MAVVYELIGSNEVSSIINIYWVLWDSVKYISKRQAKLNFNDLQI